jgi:O-6-methylguanine DNA methyltransferase
MSTASFTDRVRKVVASIPKGKVMTYGEVARKAGNPRAGRAVGSLMGRNTDYANVPCHRVVRSDGKVGEYNRGGTAAKIARLKKEGVRIEHGHVVRAKDNS